MDLNALIQETPPRSQIGRPCKVAALAETLDEPYRGALINLLRTGFQDGGETDEQIRDRLRVAGFDVGATTINRHRREACSCPKGMVE